MAEISINLLKNRPTLSEKDYQRERNFLRWGVMTLLVVVVCLIAMSLWNFIQTRRLSKLEVSLTQTSKEMQGHIEATAQQIYLKSRLKLVTTFLSERTNTKDALSKIFAIAIPGSHIGALSFEEDNQVSVQYVAQSTASLDSLLTYFKNDTGYFTQVTTKGINRTKDGNYQLTLLLTIPKEER